MPVAFRSSAFTGGAPATTLTPTKPAGVQPGDQLIVAFLIDNSAKVLSAAGWTLIRNDTDAIKGNQAVLYRRTEDGSALGAITWDGTSIYVSATVLAYSGADPTTPVNAQNGQVNAAAAAIDAPSITTTLDGCMAVWVGTDDFGGTITLPAGYTDRKLNGFDMQPGEKLLGAAGATGVVTGTHTANRSQGQLVALAPDQGGGPGRRMMMGIG